MCVFMCVVRLWLFFLWDSETCFLMYSHTHTHTHTHTQHRTSWTMTSRAASSAPTLRIRGGSKQGRLSFTHPPLCCTVVHYFLSLECVISHIGVHILCPILSGALWTNQAASLITNIGYIPPSSYQVLCGRIRRLRLLPGRVLLRDDPRC